MRQRELKIVDRGQSFSCQTSTTGRMIARLVQIVAMIMSICFVVPSPKVYAQAARVDIPLLTSGPSVPITGGPLPQALWVSNSLVYVCAHPSATLAACQASLITTYTDSTEGTACPSATQMVQLPGNTCTASSGTTANVGFWYGGGIFDYWVVSSYGSYGPYSYNPPSPSNGDCAITGCTFTGPLGFTGGGTAATTLANLGGFPITGGTLTGPLTAPSVTTSLLNNIVAIPACGGVDDDAALTTAFSAAYFNNVVMFPAHSTCVYSGVWSVNTGVQYDLNGSTIKMTGTGGGTCSEGVNGLLQFTGSGFTNAVIHNGTLEAMNASAGCIVNIGAAGAGFANRIEVKNINFSTASGVTLPQAIYVSNAGNFYIHDNIFTSSFNYDIDSPDAAAQNNGFEISGNNFQTLNTISNYQVNLTNAQTGHIHDNVFESGPNGIKANGVINGLDIGINWFGDPSGVGTSIYTGTSGSAVHIHDNFIYSSGTGSVGIQDNSQESTVENNYITLADTCISTNSAAPQVTVIGNKCLSFGSTGLKANAPNMVIQNNLWSGLNASSIGVDSEAQDQTIGPNQYYVPGSGSVTINCGSTYDILMESGANVPTACKTLSLHNTSLAPGNAAIFPDGITTTSCVGCSSGFTLTTLGTSGAATLTGTVLNIPIYAPTTAQVQSAINGQAITPSTVAAGTTNAAVLADSCPAVLISSQICVKADPFNASGFRAISQATAVVTSGATSMTLLSVIGFSVGQTMRINAAATTRYIQSVTITGITGNLVSFTPATQVTTGSAPVVWTDGDTSTVGTTSAGSSMVVANATTYSIGQGVFIAGAGISGADYIGKIVGVSSNTIALSPATSTSISTGALVRHDDTAAFQAAINLATVTNPRINIVVPDGHYNWNGPAQTTSSGSSLTAIVTLPSSPYLPYIETGGSTVSPTVVNIEGQAQPSVGSLYGPVIQSDRTGTTMLSGDSEGAYLNYTNVEVNLKDLIFRTYDNPNVSAINLGLVARASVTNLVIDTGLPATCGYSGVTSCIVTMPTYSNSVGLNMPGTDNEGDDVLSASFVTGYFTDQILGEHTDVIGGAWSAFAANCYATSAGVHPIYADRLEAENCTTGIISLSSTPVALIVDTFGQQSVQYLINDPNNTLRGQVTYGEATIPLPPSVGAKGITINISSYLPPSSVTPSSLAGLAWWFKADTLLSSLANGASVNYWPDSSGNKYLASLAIGSTAPTFNTSALNGYPAVVFAGLGAMSINDRYFNPFAGTLFVVYKASTFTNYQSVVSGNTVCCNFALQFGSAAEANLVNAQSASLLTGTATWSTGTWYQMNGSFETYPATATLNLGAITSATVSSDGSGTVSFIASQPINCIGGQSSNCSLQLLNGALAELFYFDRALSSDEVKAMQTYLYQKYGVLANQI